MPAQRESKGPVEARFVSIVICEGNRLFADALSALLCQQGFDVRAVARSAGEIVAAVRRTQPDICLLERSLPDGDGLDAIEEILATNSAVRVVVLAAESEVSSASEALVRGAAAYVHKSNGIGVLTESIRRVRAGAVVVDTVRSQEPRSRRPVSAIQMLASHLTLRERQCLGLLVEGMGTKAMAHRLGVAPTTIRSHVQSALTKLGVHSRLEAAALTVRHDLASPAEAALGRLEHVV
ncbi:response regulator transcription factor [Pseudonocardia halophobica]|uniref:response regulator transcription factor n=1 Tax=Pseudonocardia halophobica TaxID=29401 RepID=UPI003D8C9D41